MTNNHLDRLTPDHGDEGKELAHQRKVGSFALPVTSSPSQQPASDCLMYDGIRLDIHIDRHRGPKGRQWKLVGFNCAPIAKGIAEILGSCQAIRNE